MAPSSVGFRGLHEAYVHLHEGPSMKRQYASGAQSSATRGTSGAHRRRGAAIHHAHEALPVVREELPHQLLAVPRAEELGDGRVVGLLQTLFVRNTVAIVPGKLHVAGYRMPAAGGRSATLKRHQVWVSLTALLVDEALTLNL